MEYKECGYKLAATKASVCYFYTDTGGCLPSGYSQEKVEKQLMRKMCITPVLLIWVVYGLIGYLTALPGAIGVNQPGVFAGGLLNIYGMIFFVIPALTGLFLVCHSNDLIRVSRNKSSTFSSKILARNLIGVYLLRFVALFSISTLQIIYLLNMR